MIIYFSNSFFIVNPLEEYNWFIIYNSFERFLIKECRFNILYIVIFKTWLKKEWLTDLLCGSAHSVTLLTQTGSRYYWTTQRVARPRQFDAPSSSMNHSPIVRFPSERMNSIHYKNFYTYLKIHFHLINRAYNSTFSKFQSHRLQTSLLSIPFPPPSIPNEKRRFALKYDSILARSTGWRCERISPDPLPSPTPSRNYTQPPSYARVAMHARRLWV